jgi:D-alanine transaminase
MSQIVFLNGDYLPIEKAYISPLDRGFLYADSVFEVIFVFNNKIIELQAHLHRLQTSLATLNINNPYSDQEYEKMISNLINKNPSTNNSVYLQITRGVAKARTYAMPDNLQPTVFGMSTALEQVNKTTIQQGIKVVCIEDIRSKNCNIKTNARVDNILMHQGANKQKADEVIIIDNGYALESTKSNLFIVQNNTIISPPLDRHILPGLTRETIFKLAESNNILHKQVKISTENLKNADEIWLTSSTSGLIPVVQLDNKLINNGKPGPIWDKMFELYQEYLENYER